MKEGIVQKSKNLIRAYSVSIVVFLIGISYIAYSIFLYCKSNNIEKNGGEFTALANLMVGIAFFAMGIASYRKERNGYSIRKNKQFKYGFDIRKEYLIYKSIGLSKPQKLFGEQLKLFENYTEWRDYITEQYNDESLIRKDYENFFRYMNQFKIDAIQMRETINSIMVPGELALLGLCQFDDTAFVQKDLLLFIYLCVTCALIIAAFCENRDNRLKEQFITDLLEILSKTQCTDKVINIQ